ncbi:MAG: carbohydrate kinase family protein [Anaerolineaceae bacterium]|nr:carbohydrate kinase family protein [Anaerolineaceae bacterium]
MTEPTKVLLLGGILLDRYFEVDRYPEAGQDTLIHKFYERVGGCSLNVAVTLKNLGSQPYIVNKFGDDEVGGKIERYIQSLAVPTTCMLKVNGGQTGYCLTILDGSGERTFFTSKGCEVEFSPQNVPLPLRADFAFVYITGYYLLNRQTAAGVLELVQTLHQNGCQVVFDPGPLVGEMDTEQLHQLLKISDWLIPNQAELSQIQKKIGVSGDLHTWLFEQGMQGMALKKGSQGVDILTRQSSFTLKGLPVDITDTNGAGDSFAGGFIHGLANGYTLRQAAALANACGAYTTTINGPHGIFSMDEIKYFTAKFEDDNS